MILSIMPAAESLNSLYKRELIDPKKGWEGVADVMLATMDWVQWYSEERIHSYSGDMPPKNTRKPIIKRWNLVN
jgi:transposase InsO family protein